MFIDSGGDLTLGAQEFKAITDAESSSASEPPSYTSSDLTSGPANPHLKDGSSVFTIHTSATVQNGKGAFASRLIQRGDLILSEKPIFTVANVTINLLKCMSIITALRNLSPYHLDHFLSLHNSHTECSCFPNPLLGILATNAFDINDDDSGICLRASRFNHSCSPNARFSFNSNTGELRIYALGNIPPGEEIFVSYISGRSLYASPRRSRQDVLRDRYHFTCACSVCNLSEAESKMSDVRRVKVNELSEIIPSFTSTLGIEFLKAIVEAIHLLKEEGYLADADEFTEDAVLACAYHSDWVSAKYWARLTYQTRVAEFGEDSTRAAEFYGHYLNPKSFLSAGQGPPEKFTEIRLESTV
jgi:hypothetical protein